MELLSPRSVLREKEEDILKELKKDDPLLILISPRATLCISAGESKAHQKIIHLAPTSIILCARGNPSDLVVFKREIRNAITNFVKIVSASDLSGRMLAMAAAEILRNHYLKDPKALAVQAAFLDFTDPEDPVCVISPTGDQLVGTSFLLKESEILPITNTPQTLPEMKEYAKANGIPAEGQEHVWVFMSGDSGVADAPAEQENPAQPNNSPEQPDQTKTAEHPSAESTQEKSET